MTGIVKTTEKNLMVFSGRANPELAEEVASMLGTELVPSPPFVMIGLIRTISASRNRSRIASMLMRAMVAAFRALTPWCA